MPAPTPDQPLPTPDQAAAVPKPESQKKPLGERAKDLLSRFTPWVKKSEPDKALEKIDTFAPEEHIDSTQEYFDKLKDISEGELTQESVDLAEDFFIGLARQDDLVYSKAGEAVNIFNVLEEKARSAGLRMPIRDRQFERAYQRLERKKEIAGVLEEFRSLAKTNPDIFKPGSKAIYDFLVGQNNGTLDKAFGYLELYPSYIENIKADLTRFPTVKKEEPPSWLVVNSEAKRRQDQSGRFYLNPKSEFIQPVFIQLIEELSKNPNLAFQAKVINPTLYKSPGFELADFANMSRALTRSDKIVLYFDSANQEEIIKILQKFWDNSGSASRFDSKKTKFAFTPKFRGIEMPGLSFGQEPTPEYSDKYSFTDLRAKILQETQNYINEPDFEKHFMDALKTHNIDPSDPAFNWPQEEGQDRFSGI
ncbi:hypothetical protein HYU94_03745 [Candidatus Daviesbacteria bacterium]|nr:hypothetical protein [Candidatus Daviesbacteria bacterium]